MLWRYTLKLRNTRCRRRDYGAERAHWSVSKVEKRSIFPSSSSQLSTILTVAVAIYHDIELTSKWSRELGESRRFSRRNYAFCTWEDRENKLTREPGRRKLDRTHRSPEEDFRKERSQTRRGGKRFNCCSRNKSMNSVLLFPTAITDASVCIDKENKRKMKHVNWFLRNGKKWKSTKKWVVGLTIRLLLNFVFWENRRKFRLIACCSGTNCNMSS